MDGVNLGDKEFKIHYKGFDFRSEPCILGVRVMAEMIKGDTHWYFMREGKHLWILVDEIILEIERYLDELG